MYNLMGDPFAHLCTKIKVDFETVPDIFWPARGRGGAESEFRGFRGCLNVNIGQRRITWMQGVLILRRFRRQLLR